MNMQFSSNFIINETTLPTISQFAEIIPGGFYIYHADGNQELIYFNSQMVSFYGCENSEEFKTLVGNSFKGIVHSNEYFSLENEIKLQINQNNKKAGHIKHRFVRKDGSIGIMDSYGYFGHSDYYGDIIYVCAQDITEQYNEELSIRNKQKSKRNEIINQMLGGTSTYTINPQLDKFTAVQQNQYLKDNYSVDESYTDSITRYINNDVVENDRGKMLEITALDNLVKTLEFKNEVSEVFRDVSSGVVKWYKMRAVKLADNEIVMGFISIDKEYYDELIHKKLEEDYFGMYIIDLDEMILKIQKSSPWYYAGNTGDVLPYLPAIKGFINANKGETKRIFEGLSSIDFINASFKYEDKISYTYKSNRVGKKWVTLDCIVLNRRQDKTPCVFAMGFRIADTLTIEKNELQEKLDAIRVVTGTLTEDFGCVNYVEFQPNKEEDIAVNYRTSELLKKLVPGWEKETNFTNKINMLIDKVVFTPEKDEFESNIRRERVLDELKDKDTYFVNFRVFYDNEIKYYQVKFSAVRRDGGLVGVVVGIHSVDELVKKELAIQEQLTEALQRAEAASTSKTKFLFNMSHDIRTPMNAILGFASMAKTHIEEKEKLIDYLSKIEISGQQLLILINKILEMSRIESGKIEFEEKPISIKNEFDTMVAIFAEQAKELDLNFDFKLTDIKHDSVLADVARMGSVTLNIVGNAFKYTPKGGSIFYELKEVPARKDGYATYIFTVSDTGIGMSEEYQKVLFEPFTREKSSTVSKIQGTGLGMSIVSELVRLLGGKIEVKSKLGEGTRFDITVDFKIIDDSEVVSEVKKDIDDSMFLGRRVLLVEDNDLNREIAVDILKEAGFVVEEAENGIVAVEKVKLNDHDYYDLVLMDIQMPLMDGYEATKAIREMTVGQHIPIIALSANAFMEDKEKSLAAGMDDHISKPINVAELKEAMAKFL